MIGIPQARSAYFQGQQPGALPLTFFTVPVGKVWRIWQASVQLSFNASINLAATSALDAWIEIQGGDILVATAQAVISPSTGAWSGITMDQGGRALAPGTVVRLVSTALPANTTARITGGVLWSQA